MSVDIKFCGLTRAEDAAYAASLGAAYVGVIFAGGPRHLSVDQAAGVIAGVPRAVRRVGVFAAQTSAEIVRVAEQLELDVVQLHGAADVSRIAEVRRDFGGAIWPVLRVAGPGLPANAAELIAAGDALLLDALTDGALGGTGVALSWGALSSGIAALRSTHDKPIVLAGGLKPPNVARAIAEAAPDVVDVSSGVERAPGIKDHTLMLAFRDAVTHASIFT